MKKILIFALIVINLDADITNISTKSKNLITNSQIENTQLQQGTINIDSNSYVEDVSIGKENRVNTNIFQNSAIENSTLLQGSVDVNSSSFIRTDFYSHNEITNSDIKSDSIVKQGILKVDSGDIKDSSFTLNSNIDSAIIDNSLVSQNEIDVENSTIDNLTMSGVHTIHNESQTVVIRNSDVTQGKLSVVDGSSLTIVQSI